MEQRMRRQDRAISPEECETLLNNGEYGMLACAGDSADEDAFPYALPLSYMYDGEKIYFHSAREGKKVDMLSHDARVCFTVVGDTRPCYLTNFTTLFESVMVFGKAAPVEDPQEKASVLRKLCLKYLPGHADKIEASIAGSIVRTAVYAITPERISGKARRS